jgi:O-6-methylguanine DNA methyltransferase
MPSFTCERFATGQSSGSSAIALPDPSFLRYGCHSLPWGLVKIVFVDDILVQVCVLDKPHNKSCITTPGASHMSSRDAGSIVESLLRQTYDGPCQLLGTQFQFSVWRSACTIPYGSCITYGDLAKRMQRPQSARAVGLALSQNPLALLIPCHRIVASKGALGGYRWGAPLKRALLDAESLEAG